MARIVERVDFYTPKIKKQKRRYAAFPFRTGQLLQRSDSKKS